MFSLIKQVFIVLPGFSSSLSTKCVSLNDETCMVIPTIIDLTTIELKYYPFMISLDKCGESCNVLSPKICALKKTKDINVKVFNMITNEKDAETVTKHISCDCKCKFNSTTYNSNQKWNNKTRQCKSNNYSKSEKDCSWNPSTCFCENSKYLQSIADISVIACEIIDAMDIVSAKMTNTIAINVSKTCHSKKARYKFC